MKQNIILAICGSQIDYLREILKRLSGIFGLTEKNPEQFMNMDQTSFLIPITHESELEKLKNHKHVYSIFLKRPASGIRKTEKSFRMKFDYQILDEGDLQKTFAQIAGIIFQDILGNTVTAIDGTAGSGKGTYGKMLGEHYGGIHIDSGLIYRHITYVLAIKNGLRHIHDQIPKYLRSMEEDFNPKEMMENEYALRSTRVDKLVSNWSQIKEVRESVFWLLMRSYASGKNHIIAEGRDMTTHVFPRAQHKFFVDCPIEIRAERRAIQRNIKDVKCMTQSLKKRDSDDMNRKLKPLVFKPECGVIKIENVDPIQKTFDQILEHYK